MKKAKRNGCSRERIINAAMSCASLEEMAARLKFKSEEALWDLMLKKAPGAELFLDRNEAIRNMKSAANDEDRKSYRLTFIEATWGLYETKIISSKLTDKQQKFVDMVKSIVKWNERNLSFVVNSEAVVDKKAMGDAYVKSMARVLNLDKAEEDISKDDVTKMRDMNNLFDKADEEDVVEEENSEKKEV